MNNVILMGRLTRSPEVKTAGSGMTVTKYTLAVDRRGKREEGKQTADFINCIAFDKAGDFAGKYFTHGMRVLVRGHIQTGSYQKKDGTKVYTTDVVVDEQEFADSKSTGSAPAESQKTPAQPGKEDFMDVPDGADDEGLPFN